MFISWAVAIAAPVPAALAAAEWAAVLARELINPLACAPVDIANNDIVTAKNVLFLKRGEIVWIMWEGVIFSGEKIVSLGKQVFRFIRLEPRF
ncbi:hypothetical protein BGC30_10195 [Novacetimonas hansenii]|nr:hypothetical protein BGC30_10195 [Novacetimonas hansenii]